MEYIPFGPLKRFIPKDVGLPIELVRAYGAQLVVFLEYLHNDLEVCHRDLKPGNIMIGDNLYLKIIDFGDAKPLYNCENFGAPFFSGSQQKLQNIQKAKRSNTFVGTPLYVAPEMLDKTQSGAFSDFWALGIILYEMACGKTPFLGRTEMIVFDKILRRQFEWPESLTDHNLKNLIDQLLQLRPESRVGMSGHDALKSHPFFAGVNWEAVRDQKVPVPAHHVVYSSEDPQRVVSFTLVPPPEGYLGPCGSKSSWYGRGGGPRDGPEEARTAETVKSMKAFQKINTEQYYRKPQAQCAFSCNRKNCDGSHNEESRRKLLAQQVPSNASNEASARQITQQSRVGACVDQDSASQSCRTKNRPATCQAAVLNPEKSRDQFFHIDVQDTYQGVHILKRGPVQVSQSILGSEATRQLVLVGNQKLLVLKTPSQILKAMSADQIRILEDQEHPFYQENSHLLLMNNVDEVSEANECFTIYDDMVESYLALNNGKFKVSQLTESGGGTGGFEVRTSEISQVFQCSRARDWIHFLNQLKDRK